MRLRRFCNTLFLFVACPRRYLPGVLDAFERSEKHQYLLLSSLKELIVCHANTDGLDFSPYVDQVCGVV